jgi:hypothetical protein
MADDRDPAEGTLAHHLHHLAATADDVAALLSRPHADGEVSPEALGKAEHLSTSLKDVIHALTHHEHLAMSSDDIWKALTVKHRDHESGEFS